MLLDRELAYAVLDRIETHPEGHDQSDWVSFIGDGQGCGTVACFAGWAVVLAGGSLLEWCQARITGLEREPRRYFDEDVSYTEGHIASVAMTLLGLDEARAYALFHEDHTLHDLRRLVGEYWPEPESEPASEPGPLTPEQQADAFTKLRDGVEDVVTQLRIVSTLLATLIEDEQLYERAAYGTEGAERHRIQREVEQDLIAARTSVDNTAYYIGIGDREASKGQA